MLSHRVNWKIKEKFIIAFEISAKPPLKENLESRELGCWLGPCNVNHQLGHD
jgi:hypothetical protein